MSGLGHSLWMSSVFNTGFRLRVRCSRPVFDDLRCFAMCPRLTVLLHWAPMELEARLVFFRNGFRPARLLILEPIATITGIVIVEAHFGVGARLRGGLRYGRRRIMSIVASIRMFVRATIQLLLDVGLSPIKPDRIVAAFRRDARPDSIDVAPQRIG